jgi:hypothetical protein
MEFYKVAAEETAQANLKSLFHSFSEKNREHKDRMERARRETVIEMALEPLTGLKLNEHLAQIDAIVNRDNMNSVEKAIALERIMQKIYNQASLKVMNRSADTGDLLSRLCQESMDRESMLESIHKKDV